MMIIRQMLAVGVMAGIHLPAARGCQAAGAGGGRER